MTYRFRLIDLFVVFTALSVAVMLAAWQIREWRSRTQLTNCQDNLRAIAMQMFDYSSRNPQTKLCSGRPHYDHGPAWDAGWTVDFLQANPKQANRLHCPANPVFGSAFLPKLLNPEQKVYQATAPWLADPWLAGERIVETELPETPEQLHDLLLSQGNDSNYSASWFLIRTMGRLEFGNQYFAQRFYMFPNPEFPTDHRQNTLGPLKQRILETGPIFPVQVPLLGDGRAGANGRRLLRLSSGSPRLWIGQQWQPAEHGVRVDEDQANESKGPGFGRLYQDTTNWTAPHVHAAMRLAVFVMADGSTQVFVDNNRDGILFPEIDSRLPQPAAGSIDMPRARFFSGLFLLNFSPGPYCL